MKSDAQDFAELRLMALKGELLPIESIEYNGSDPDIKRAARLSVRDLERYVLKAAA